MTVWPLYSHTVYCKVTRLDWKLLTRIEMISLALLLTYSTDNNFLSSYLLYNLKFHTLQQNLHEYLSILWGLQKCLAWSCSASPLLHNYHKRLSQVSLISAEIKVFRIFYYQIVFSRPQTQVSWIQAETNAILTMNGNMVTQNPRYAVVTQVSQ